MNKRMNKRMKKPELIPDWQKVLKHAWSIKFTILSGVCSAGEVIVAYFPDALPRGAMAGFAGSFAMLGIISRFIMQKEITREIE